MTRDFLVTGVRAFVAITRYINGRIGILLMIQQYQLELVVYRAPPDAMRLVSYHWGAQQHCHPWSGGEAVLGLAANKYSADEQTLAPHPNTVSTKYICIYGFNTLSIFKGASHPKRVP